ncbi:hypothetical protein GCM10010909_17690 [Acidocella aquatica]|uniref:Uncharacterized protein n=1 Tax=Acidocella aquatica TaxID=1922313 RepID=A0ABQ6A610_9PROT|nr:hypothetical protein GCM10010909_17690 [Acidocella aquatica]
MRTVLLEPLLPLLVEIVNGGNVRIGDVTICWPMAAVVQMNGVFWRRALCAGSFSLGIVYFQ